MTDNLPVWARVTLRVTRRVNIVLYAVCEVGSGSGSEDVRGCRGWEGR